MVKIGINGFGRIGRMFLRAAANKGMEVAAINDPAGDPQYMEYLFVHDSSHGRYCGSICSDKRHLIVNGEKILILKEKDPKKIPWNEAGVEYVVECSGQFTTQKKASELLVEGVKRVLISAPSDAPMFVPGVNMCSYDPSEKVVSMASCTTNCCAPLVKVLQTNFGVEEALMTTIHAATLSQKVLDGSGKKAWRDGRSTLQNIIPASTGAAKAVAKVIPELQGKITGMAFRVPTPNVSVVDLTVRLRSPGADLEKIKCAVRKAAEFDMEGILGYTEEEVVSTDVMSTTYSSIFDAKASMALNDNFVKLIAWYDNECGYATRLTDMICFMSKKDAKDACDAPKEKTASK